MVAVREVTVDGSSRNVSCPCIRTVETSAAWLEMHEAKAYSAMRNEELAIDHFWSVAWRQYMQADEEDLRIYCPPEGQDERKEDGDADRAAVQGILASNQRG